MIKKILKLINNANILNELVSTMSAEKAAINYSEKHAINLFNFNLTEIELIGITRKNEYTCITYLNKSNNEKSWCSNCSLEQHAVLVNKFNEVTNNSK